MSYAATQTFSGAEQCSASEHWDAENERCAAGLCPPGLVVGSSGDCVEPGSDPPRADPGGSVWGGDPAPSSGGGGSGSPRPSAYYDTAGAASGGGLGLWLAGLLGVGLVGYWFYGRAG